MVEHLHRFKKKKERQYLSSTIQNELLSSMFKLISNSIISSINSSKYFVIVVGSTPDISHQESLTIMRSVSFKSNQFKIS